LGDIDQHALQSEGSLKKPHGIGNRRQFAFVGQYGQRICIDPASKLVMVHTALDEASGEVWPLWSALVEQLG
jgi:hypothetical protein